MATAGAYLASAKEKKPSEEYTPEQRAIRCKEINKKKKTSKCWKCGKISHWGKEFDVSNEEQKKYQESQIRTSSD